MLNLIPIPGIPDEQLGSLSRQQRYKLRKYAEGLCGSCGKHPRCDQSRTLCEDCLSVQRERMRSRTGAGRRNLRAKSYVAENPSVAPKTARRRQPAKGEVRPTTGASAKAEAGPKRADEPRRRRR